MKTSLPKSVFVKKIIKENFRTKAFITNVKIKAKPGQFIMVWLPRKAEKPFSITDDDPLTFTVMSVGPFTKTLNLKIKKGDKIWYRGPFGNGIFKPINGKKILVSGGCGCAPLYFLAKKIRMKKATRVIVGAKTKKELLFNKKFKKLGFTLILTTDDGSAGIKGFTTDVLEKILKKEKIAQICKKYKTKYQLSLEALIKCGFGICGSCSRSGQLVCKDGPIFSKWLN